MGENWMLIKFILEEKQNGKYELLQNSFIRNDITNSLK